MSDTLIENPLDPRSSLKNLNDGNYCTKDDLHSWLAEVDPGKKPRLSFIFRKIEQFSLIRIWNYNRNRVHANRGVKELNIRLDNQVSLSVTIFRTFEKYLFQLVFSGEVRCGSGSFSSKLPGDNVLFTTDEQILSEIAQNDSFFTTMSQ